MKLSKIKPNPDNPRIVKDDKFKKLVKSIKEFPKMMELRPMVIDSEGIVLGGNMRLKALKELGYKDIPNEWVKFAKDLTEEEKKRFIIADNVGFGLWNWEQLANEWNEQELIDWGLDIPDFETAEELEVVEDDYSEPEQMKVDVVEGDLIEFVCSDGRVHRLLCGDSTCSDSVGKLMDGKTAELLFTSPPYSDMRDYNGNKDLSIDNLAEFIPTFMPYVNFQVVNLGLQRKNNEIVQYWDKYIEIAKACGLKLLSWNVWDKTMGGSIASATSMFLMTHEWIFVFGEKAKKINRTIPNQLDKYERRHGKDWQSGLVDKSIRGKDDKMKTTSSKTYTHHQLHTVTQQTPELGPIRKTHPATFPIGLPKQYIEAMTSQGEIVAESFTGSGTTMVAAHQLKRTCYGMELDCKYCQVIIDRMTKLDETLTVKINGKEYKKEAEKVPF